MIERVDMYRVVCDGCGKIDDGDYAAWESDETARQMAVDSEWVPVGDDKDYCPDCGAPACATCGHLHYDVHDDAQACEDCDCQRWSEPVKTGV